MKKITKLKLGDFVRVSENTHDERMPKSRMGHIIEEYKTIVHYTNKKPESTGVWSILMTNGKTLRVHEMFLELVDESR
tara:strand:- start:198 stop:431 length:234 start_codon:yes stop_codon:yes gene_type:complete